MPLRVKENVSLESFLAENIEYWTKLIPLCELHLANHNLIVSGGGGGFGSDGFVAASQSSNDLLVWLAFFDYSNPFIELAEDSKNHVIGKTTLGELWRFDLNSPEYVVKINP